MVSTAVVGINQLIFIGFLEFGNLRDADAAALRKNHGFSLGLAGIQAMGGAAQQKGGRRQIRSG
ncbi:hypothetical protein [Pandoraea sp. XY-2]|uniref:hypothetical protein n=1 Tax=Pandoraea sp. XY-2 TaxID=2518599 RepID=UPI0010210C0F|nr:hypothetical protein [Pandoraea sp. XY-2]